MNLISKISQPDPVKVAQAIARAPTDQLENEIVAIIKAERAVADLRIKNFKFKIMEHIRNWKGSAYFVKQVQGNVVAKARIQAQKLVTQEAVAISMSLAGLTEDDNDDNLSGQRKDAGSAGQSTREIEGEVVKSN